MDLKEVWTVEGTEATDKEGECYWIDEGWLYATEFASRVPLDTIADLLRAAGYKVAPPEPRPAPSGRPDEET